MVLRLRPPGRAPRKHDKKGRSGEAIDKRSRPKNQPRECDVDQWAWLPLELMDSPAWAALSPNAVRLVHRLMVEHVHQGGTENGRLICTHADFIRYGCTAAAIREGIEEAHAFGIIRLTRQGGKWGGTNRPNMYRLTWLGWWDDEGVGRDPTNEWRGVTDELIRGFQAERERKRAQTRNRRATKRTKAEHTPESSGVVSLNSAVRGRFPR